MHGITNTHTATGPIGEPPGRRHWKPKPRPRPAVAAVVTGPLAVLSLVAALMVIAGPAAAQPALCFGSPTTIVAVAGVPTVGTNGDDVIMGTSTADDIDGRGGDDKICSGGGADHVKGGPGRDMIDLGAGNDTGSGGAGNDLIHGRGGKDRLNGNGGHDRLLGGGKNDRLRGHGGRDQLLGGGGRDRLLGGGGNDDLNGQGGRDVCDGGAGTDANASCNEATISIDIDAALLNAVHLGPGWTDTRPSLSLGDGSGLLRACGVDIENDIGIADFGRALSLFDGGSEPMTVGHSVRVQTSETARGLITRTAEEAGACTGNWSRRFPGATGISTFTMLSPLAVQPVGHDIVTYRVLWVFDDDQPGVPDTESVIVVVQFRCGPAVSRILVRAAASPTVGDVDAVVSAAHVRLRAALAGHGVGCPG